MALSISITDLVKMFRDRGISDRGRISDYLDSISEHASRIAQFWAKAYAGDRISLELELARMNQRIWYRTLYHLYGDASGVVFGMDDDQQQELFNALGSLLATRNKIKTAYDKVLSGSVHELRSLVETLQDEAGVLKALSIQFRALR